MRRDIHIRLITSLLALLLFSVTVFGLASCKDGVPEPSPTPTAEADVTVPEFEDTASFYKEFRYKNITPEEAESYINKLIK